MRSWTNGRKAAVHLVVDSTGRKAIVKCYRKGFAVTLLREYLVIKHLSRNLEIVPRVLGIDFRRRQLLLSHIEGERVFEWVLQRYGDAGLDLEQFRSYDHMDTCPIVGQAFRRFRESNEPSTGRLKQGIEESYTALHETGFTHGSADPRNVIYDGTRAYIIDFDHSRPRLRPRESDRANLAKWFGLAGC